MEDFFWNLFEINFGGKRVRLHTSFVPGRRVCWFLIPNRGTLRRECQYFMLLKQMLLLLGDKSFLLSASCSRTIMIRRHDNSCNNFYLKIKTSINIEFHSRKGERIWEYIIVWKKRNSGLIILVSPKISLDYVKYFFYPASHSSLTKNNRCCTMYNIYLFN